MPKNGRTQVIVRLDTATISKLTTVCGDRTKTSGKMVGRSEVLTDLIERAYRELAQGDKRSRRTAAG